MLQIESLRAKDLREFIPTSLNCNIIEIAPEDADMVEIRKGAKIRCVDYRFGMQEDPKNPGSYIYVSETVPQGYAWFGALDGIAASFRGGPEKRYNSARRLVEETLHLKAATHGDFTKGDRGCLFYASLIEGILDDLEPISIEMRRALRKKLNIEHDLLNPAPRKPKGFKLNPHHGWTGLPNGGEYYCIDLALPEAVGIKPEKALAQVVRFAELMLPASNRNIYLIAA